jgi:hypothetical protein
MTFHKVTLPVAAVLGALALSGCVTPFDSGPPVAIVRDLSKVAGCEFRGTVTPPHVRAGLRSADGHVAYVHELKRRAAAVGGTHLYLLNEAAGWGAAQAVGTAYRCYTT